MEMTLNTRIKVNLLRLKQYTQSLFSLDGKGGGLQKENSEMWFKQKVHLSVHLENYNGKKLFSNKT